MEENIRAVEHSDYGTSRSNLQSEYSTGDRVTYRLWNGSFRTLTVREKSVNIKNERPGFAGGGAWGYDSQIVSIDRPNAWAWK